MSEFIRARVLLGKMIDDTEPSIVAAVDECIWEHWTDDEEAAWIAAGKRTWGIDHDSEFKVVVARFAPQDLVDAFATVEVGATVEGARDMSELAHRGAVPPDPTRQAAQRLLGLAGPYRGETFEADHDADVRLVAEAVMERNNQSIIGEAHPAKGAGMCDCDCGRGGVCPGCSRSAMLEACSAENAETCATGENLVARVQEAARALAAGTDESIAYVIGASVEDVRCVTSAQPSHVVSGDAIHVRTEEDVRVALESSPAWLRADRDSWLSLAKAARADLTDCARREAVLQAEVVRLREALEAAEDALRGCVPWVGTSGRGAAQEALAVACDLVGYDATDWTSHPDVLERRRAAPLEDS